jgi:hypothetical protein
MLNARMLTVRSYSQERAERGCHETSNGAWALYVVGLEPLYQENVHITTRAR